MAQRMVMITKMVNGKVSIKDPAYGVNRRWEKRGQTIPDSSTLIRLSELFNVTINELLNGERRTDNTIKELEETTL